MSNLIATSVSELATKALVSEIRLGPKPGLVDRLTNGAHNDMDYDTFISSIKALSPYFRRYFLLGYNHPKELSHTELFNKLRSVGIEAEQAMFKATHGVNTHKGANFSFAVLLGATGYYLHNKNIDKLPISSHDTESILTIVSLLTGQLIEQDLKPLNGGNTLSHGEKLFLSYGVKGIRGEAADGYPSLHHLALPYIRSHFNNNDIEYSLLKTLIYLMSSVEDGNILHRGGYPALEMVQRHCHDIHHRHLSKARLVNCLRYYDAFLTESYISPGGSADLLSLSVFWGFMEGIIDKNKVLDTF